MDKKDLGIGLLDDAITVCEEERFGPESTEGTSHVIQCAYGSFTCSVSLLPVPAKASAAKAIYKDRILRIE